MQTKSRSIRWLALWGSLADVRNDIDHAGMRQEPREAQDLIKQIQGFILKLEALLL